MRENNFLIFFLSFFFISFNSQSEIIVLKKCDHKEDGFLKNEYILNLNELIMTRNYVYNEKTYQKYRLTDLSVKKSIEYEIVFVPYPTATKIVPLNAILFPFVENTKYLESALLFPGSSLPPAEIPLVLPPAEAE